jgi:hypothetical protein
MDQLTSNIQHDAWDSINEVFTEILIKIRDWEETGESNVRYLIDGLLKDESLKYETVDDVVEQIEDIKYSRQNPKFDEEYPDLYDESLTEFEEALDTETDYGLGDYIQSINKALHAKDVTTLKAEFDNLSRVCDELRIDIVDEYDALESHLDVLSIQQSELIYLPTQNLIHIPRLIIAAQDELIGLLAKNPELLFRISPRKFEEIIAEIFLKRGYHVELTKATRDGGRDIVAMYEHMNIRTKYLIECKRYARTNKVSIAIVQRLFGVKIAEAANKAILATTSTFTRDARQFASNHIWDLDLKDYTDILAWIKAY